MSQDYSPEFAASCLDRTAVKLPVHDLSAGEMAYGDLVRDGSRWVRIGCTYGYPGARVLTVKAIYGGVTIRDEKFHVVSHTRSARPMPGILEVVVSGPGRWDRGRAKMTTTGLLNGFEPWKPKAER